MVQRSENDWGLSLDRDEGVLWFPSPKLAVLWNCQIMMQDSDREWLFSRSFVANHQADNTDKTAAHSACGITHCNSHVRNHFYIVMNVCICDSYQLNMSIWSVSNFFLAIRKVVAPIIHIATWWNPSPYCALGLYRILASCISFSLEIWWHSTVWHSEWLGLTPSCTASLCAHVQSTFTCQKVRAVFTVSATNIILFCCWRLLEKIVVHPHVSVWW
jgi:hypothetical protein